VFQDANLVPPCINLGLIHATVTSGTELSDDGIVIMVQETFHCI